MMTKEEKTAKLQEIEEQVEDFYTEDEAVALVNGILEPWSPLCRLSFGEDAFKITYSFSAALRATLTLTTRAIRAGLSAP